MRYDFLRRYSECIRSKNLRHIVQRFKSTWVLVIFAALFASFINPISVQAATIKNGVSCAKADLKRKVGSKNYVCGKNPYLNPTKLTWVLRECPQTYALYLESKDQYEIFKDILNSAGAEGKAEADKLLAGISSLETLMKSQVCKRGK